MNTNDGTSAAPRLVPGMCMGTLAELPLFSTGPTGSERAVLAAIRDAGIPAVQGAAAAECAVADLISAGSGRVNAVGEAAPMARALRDQGHVCATLHVGWGLEDTDTVLRLVEDILLASAGEQLPLYIETHRATITQDIWRAAEIVRRFPEVRFNGDFSHWYTGLEMVYGGIDNKFEFMEPVFERVRFLHGRIGNPGCIQVAIEGANDDSAHVRHFREMWTRSMAGFLRSARPGDYLIFAPELLPPRIYYARTVPGSDGNPCEESDRWEQALIYLEIANACFADARRRLEL